ncbi:adenylyl-sulfate kinase [Candidatus Woesearchaeota archaeon]|nr:adenylyl-sulfate kinase [Candidatus Woesearchaeota archaeon]
MSFAIWVTGLPGSGKSTIAKILAKKINAKILQLDKFRKEIVPSPKYDEQERVLVYTKLAEKAAEIFQKHNIIIDATDNLQIGRKKAKELIKNFFVVQINCPINICEERESKRINEPGIHDLYFRAKKGEITLPGINAPYLKEKNPLITLDSNKLSAKQSATEIIKKIKKIL